MFPRSLKRRRTDQSDLPRSLLQIPEPAAARKDSLQAESFNDIPKLEEKDVEKHGQSEGSEDGAEEKGAPERITKAQKAMALAAAIITNILTLGATQAFGVFQVHYGSEAAVNDGILRPNQMSSRAGIAAIGSLGNGGIVAVFGLFFCPWLPLIGQKVKFVCFAGALLMALGLGAAAASTNLWHLVITQGVLFGIGSGILNYTLAPILPEYFSHHSGLAQGLAASGAAVGGVCFSILQGYMLEAIGTRQTLGILACIYFVLGSMASAMAQKARKYKKLSYRIVTGKTFKDPLFTLLTLINLFVPLILRTPTTFGPDFSESLGYSRTVASYQLAIISGVGIVARPFLGYIADITGHQNMLILSTAMYAVTTLGSWFPAAMTGSKPVWIVFLVCCGLVNGAFLQLANSVSKSLFADDQYYSYSGAFTTLRGIGFVVGTPIAGAIVRKVRDDELAPADFIPLTVYTGAFLAVSTAFLLLVRWLHGRKNGWNWVG